MKPNLSSSFSSGSISACAVPLAAISIAAAISLMRMEPAVVIVLFSFAASFLGREKPPNRAET
jgi:hypothetical protein